MITQKLKIDVLELQQEYIQLIKNPKKPLAYSDLEYKRWLEQQLIIERDRNKKLNSVLRTSI